MIRAIFFDVGDVLAHEGFTAGLAAYEKKYSLPEGRVYEAAHDRPHWRQFTLGNITEEEYLKSVGEDLGGEFHPAELSDLIVSNFRQNQELIDYLKTLKNDYILGIISNSPKEWFDIYAAKFGWDDLFRVKAVSGNVHIRKPERGIFEYALKQAGLRLAEAGYGLAKAGVKGDEVIYVDNRPERVDGAHELGMKVVVYKNNDQIKRELETILASGTAR